MSASFNLYPPSDTHLMELVSTMRTVQTVVSVISLIASLVVIATPIIFPSMWVSKIYMKMIVMISICDALVSLALAFGYPTGALCTAQGAMTMFFSRASWMWSCLIIFQLNHLVKRGKIYFSFQKMNILVLVFNLVLECLPFTTKTYYGSRNADGDEGNAVCQLYFSQNAEKYYFVWVLVVYALPLLFMTTYLVVMSAVLYFRLRSLNNLFNNSLAGSVILYPGQIFLTYAPLLYYFFTHYNNIMTKDNYDAALFYRQYRDLHIIYSWVGLQGVFNCAIFFYNSAEARFRWRTYLSGCWASLVCGGKNRAGALKTRKKMAERAAGGLAENDYNSKISAFGRDSDLSQSLTQMSSSTATMDDSGNGDSVSYDFLDDDALQVTARRENHLPEEEEEGVAAAAEGGQGQGRGQVGTLSHNVL